MADITKDLLIGSVDADELSEVIIGFYGHGREHTQDEVVYSRSGEDAFAVKLRYNGPQIVAIETGPGFRSEDLSQLRDKIQSDLLSAEQVIGRSILFSVYSINTYFRSGSFFQILPVPANAPKPSMTPTVSFNGNPFLLEFPYNSSANQAIKSKRRHRRAYQIALLLNSILEGPITMVSNNFGARWVTLHDESCLNRTYRYCGPGYSYDGFDPNGVEFASIGNWEPMARVDPASYYGQPLRLGHNLELPNNVDVLVQKFFSLPIEERDRFLRAAFWLFQSSEITSRSASFLSLIYAIDALVPPEKGKTICSSCRQSVGKSLTQRFVEFLDELIPEQAADPEIRKAARRELCKVRGDLAHGRDLLSSDRNAWTFTFNPDGISEWKSFSYASTIAKLALVNWLLK